jgi:hypothetical protein
MPSMTDEKKQETEEDRKEREEREAEKPGQTTLARYFGDEEEESTRVIDHARHYARRLLGRGKSRALLNALERHEKQKKDEKDKK